MPDKIVLLMYEAWATLDRELAPLKPTELTTRYDGGSSIAWTVGHVTNMLDSWVNARFQGLPLNRTISNPDFRAGGSGEAREWPALHAAVVSVRDAARRYLDSGPDLERVIPYDGSIKFLRPTGLRLSYAIARIAAHHLMHAGEIATVRTRLGYAEPSGQDWGRSLA